MELESDSVSSTPRSLSDEKQPIVRLMVSFGGKIIPRPHDNQLRYVGGDTRVIAVNRCISFSTLMTKLLSSSSTSSVEFSVKYQLPNEELDALITVSTDEDVENMMEEFDRLAVTNSFSNKIPRLRLFLFPLVDGEEGEISRNSSIASLLDGSKKRESWFLDALNGGSTLERGRSEASSIVSEVPDYLFGFDNNSDDMPPPPPPPPVKFRNRSGLSDVGGPGSDPGSPAYGSGSGSSAPPMPNLPPVKTKPEKTNMNQVEDVGSGGGGGVVWGPGSPYTGGHTVQPMPVYYVPATGSGPGMVCPPRNVMPVSMPVQSQYVPHYGPGPVQVQLGYPGPGPMYEVPMQGNMVHSQGLNMINQQPPMYYGVKNGGMVANYPGVGMNMGMPISRDDQDGSNIRTHQG